MGISSPVLGLRPGRCGLSRSWKLPKPDSLTLSPRSSAPRISSKKASTMSLASRLFRPTFSNKRSASSALVKVIKLLPKSSLSTEGSTETLPQQPDHLGDGRIGFRICECFLSILHNYPECKAFSARRQAFALVKVEQADRAHDGWFFGQERVQQRLDLESAVHQNGNVPYDRGETRGLLRVWHGDRLERTGIQLEHHSRLGQFE